MKVTAKVLNVRSGPGEDFRVIGQLVKDADVAVMEERAGWKWVAPPGGWVSGAYVAESVPVKPAPALRAPSGLAAIKAMFGPPGGSLATAGRVTLPASLPLGWEPNTRITVFTCHPLVVGPFTRAFNKIHDRGLWEHLHTFDGCYNNRTTKLGGKTSTHAWGISIDLNAATNRQGKPGDMHPEIVAAFEEEGFVWGGDFSGKSRDDMHVQFASQY